MLKRYFFTLILVSLFPVFAFSQLNDKKTATYIGVRAGANLNKTRWRFDEYSSLHESKWTLGMQAGLMFVFENRNKYALQTELLYSMKRKDVVSSDLSWDTNKATYHYIDIPAILRRKFDHGTFQWYIGIGPQIGFWLGGKGEFTLFDESAQLNVAYPYEINFGDSNNPDFLNVPDANKTQISFVATIGFLFPLNDSDVVGFDIRYDWGHSNMGSRDGAYMSRFSFTDNFEATNNIISVSAIYVFNTFYKRNPR